MKSEGDLAVVEQHHSLNINREHFTRIILLKISEQSDVVASRQVADAVDLAQIHAFTDNLPHQIDALDDVFFSELLLLGVSPFKEDRT